MPSQLSALSPTGAFPSTGAPVSGGVLELAFELTCHPIDAWLYCAQRIAAEHSGTVLAWRSSETVSETKKNDSLTSWCSSFLRMLYQRDALTRRVIIAEIFETTCT